MNDQLPSLYLVDGNITLFFGTSNDSLKNDILHSSLFAHLVSNANEIASREWIAAYRKNTGMMSWTIKNLSERTLSEESCSLFELLKQSLDETLTPAQLEQINQCFDLLKLRHKNSNARVALINRLQSTTVETNQTTVCPMVTIVLEDKIISLSVSLDTCEPVDGNFLNQAIPSKIMTSPVKITHWTAHLAQDNYAAIREEVTRKLGSKTKTDLFNISNGAEIRPV